MHHLTVTPAATLGLYTAHRACQPKTLLEHRAWLDADRALLGGESPLIKAANVERVNEKGEKVLVSEIRTTANEPVDVAFENHVFDHLKSALASALADGETYGPRQSEGQTPSLYGVEAHDAVEKAKKVDAPTKPAPAEKAAKKKPDGA